MEDDDCMQTLFFPEEDDLLETSETVQNARRYHCCCEFDSVNFDNGVEKKFENSQQKETSFDVNDSGRNNSDLLRAVYANDFQTVERLLDAKTASDINQKDKEGNTLLHCAVEKRSRKIVDLLLERGADMTITNSNGSSALELARASSSSDIIKSLIFRKINVPKDGSCLFWAICAAYLIPVKYDNHVFEERFEILFGSRNPTEIAEEMQKVIKGCKTSLMLYRDETLKSLVSERFRNKVINETILRPKDVEREKFVTLNHFICSNNEDFISGGTFKEEFCIEFSTEISQYDIDTSTFRPDKCDENSLQLISREIDKIPDKDKIFDFMFARYLKRMRNSKSRGGNIEIQTLSKMIRCNIYVFSGDEQHSFPCENSIGEIQLFSDGDLHYSFGLIRSPVFVEALKEGKHYEAETYLRFGIDDVNHKDRSNWTPLHFAAECGYTDIIQSLLNQGACACIRDCLGKTALDVAKYRENQNITSILSGECEIGDCVHKIGTFCSCVQWKPTKNKKVSDEGKHEDLSSYKRFGGSGLGGHDYEIELVIILLLQGIMDKERGKIQSFYIASNLEGVGDFDDVIYKCTYKDEMGNEMSKAIFLQAKLKTDQTDNSEQERKKKKQQKFKNQSANTKEEQESKELPENLKEKRITVEKLLSNARNKSGFSLKDYFDSYCKTKESFFNNIDEKQMHPIFQGDFEKLERDFIIFTTASFPSYENGKCVERYSQNIKDINGYYVKRAQLDEDHILHFGNGANSNHFYQLLFEGKKKKSIIKALTGGEGESLNGVSNDDQNISRVPNNKSEKTSDTAIGNFLKNLKLYFGQPSESELQEITKQRIYSYYRVEKDEANLIYSDVRHKAEQWWKDKKDNYFLTENVNFFKDSVKTSVLFNLEKPIDSFEGREEELRELHRVLEHNTGKLTVVLQRFSNFGSGLIGKTQLLRRYAFENSHVYDNNIVWINAESYQTLVESFFKLAKEKLKVDVQPSNANKGEIELIVEKVYKCFSKRKSLFIFDNAKHFKTKVVDDAGIDKFICSSSTENKPTVLVTSRTQEWENVEIFYLDRFIEIDSTSFIRNTLNIPPGAEDNEVGLLSETLQRLPLALQQAVAYIREKNIKLQQSLGEEFSVKDYVKKYEAEEVKVQEMRAFQHFNKYNYEKIIFITWKVTLTKVEFEDRYLDILDIIASFAPGSSCTVMFFNRIFREGLPSSISERSFKENKNISLHILERYSQICLEYGEEHSYGLVQKIAAKCLEQCKERKVLKEALELLKAEQREKATNTDPELYDFDLSISWHSFERKLSIKSKMIPDDNISGGNAGHETE